MNTTTQRGATRIRAGSKILYEGDWSNDLYARINDYQAQTGQKITVESIDGKLWFEQFDKPIWAWED